MSTDALNVNRMYFDFSIELDGKYKVHYSPAIKLNDVSWQLKLDEDVDGGGTTITVALTSTSTNSGWQCEGACRINLRCNVTNRKLNKTTIPIWMFNKNQPSSESIEIVTSSQLEQYQQNGLITFEVRLAVGPVLYPTVNMHLHGGEFVLNVPIREIEQKFTSSDTMLSGTIWCISIDKRDGHLGIFVVHKNASLNANWTWNVNCTVKVVGVNAPSKIATIETAFGLGLKSWGCPDVIPWDTLTENFCINGSVTFQIQLKIDPPEPRCEIRNKFTTATRLCKICTQENKTAAATECGHIYCFECLAKFVRENEKCPACDANATLNEIRRIHL